MVAQVVNLRGQLSNRKLTTCATKEKRAEAFQLRRSGWGDWTRFTLRAQGHDLTRR